MFGKKILSIIGARPQFIKAAVVSKAITDLGKYEEILVHTGQHYDANMSSVFFEELSIKKPKYNLGVGGGLHGANTGKMIEKIEEIILQEKPDGVMVYGDTDSTLAGAIATVKLHIPLIHVESGLRSFNRRMPEEINRILTDQVSELLFTPNKNATAQLLKEGIDAHKVQFSGDVMYDATLQFNQIAQDKFENGEFQKAFFYQKESFALLTLHRAENVDTKERLQSILSNVGFLASKVLFPIHPRTNARIKSFKLDIPENIEIVEPLGYLEMLFLEKKSELVLTDSGGVQKEAYFQGKPCITFREETEWTELVSLGVNYVVGADRMRFLDAVNKLSDVQNECFGKSIYGEGKASQIIAERIQNLIFNI
jgi:UDP-GlcNAc3NAcA epimerase